MARHPHSINRGDRNPGESNAPATIAKQAAEWLATLDDAHSEDDKRAFAAWLLRSNLHVEEFLRISALVHRVKTTAEWQRIDIEQLTQTARDAANVSQLSTARRETRRVFAWPRRFAIASIATACVAALAYVFTLLAPSAWQRDVTEFRTAVGEQRSIALADGSVIELNTRSAVRARFTTTERAVELLDGEAIFKVAKDPARPFLVVSGAARIVAIGTAFNVNARDGGAIVTVIEGRVRVSNRTDLHTAAAVLSQPAKLEVGRGERVTIVPRQPIEAVAAVDPERATAWKQRRLVFDDTPLTAVVAEFARYYDAKVIRIEDASLGARRITGVFDAGDPGALVQFLENYSDVSVRKDERGWIVASVYPSVTLVDD